MIRTLISLMLLFVLIQVGGLQAAGLGDMKLQSKIHSMKKAGVGPVIFPHTLHEKKLKCQDCHPRIFKKKRGANDISMKKNMEGKYCGSCHNSIKAFPLYHCTKCHTNVRAPE